MSGKDQNPGLLGGVLGGVDNIITGGDEKKGQGGLLGGLGQATQGLGQGLGSVGEGVGSAVGDTTKGVGGLAGDVGKGVGNTASGVTGAAGGAVSSATGGWNSGGKSGMSEEERRKKIEEM